MPMTIRKIFNVWWPLALSWILMGVELPMLTSVVARLPNPEVNLAAYGGVVFPLALILEAPILMLLSASTALSHDIKMFRKLYRFTILIGGFLTFLHALVAFTPLYDYIVQNLMGVPEKIIEPGRVGLQAMTFWAVCIGFRRLHQGVLIRFGFPQGVGIGTILRLVVVGLLLVVFFNLKTVPGVLVATVSQAIGVFCEALYAMFQAQPFIKRDLKNAELKTEMSWLQFARFYTPLAFTSVFFLIWQPVCSAAMSRMVQPIESLAAWSVVSGLLQIFRSMGLAFNEVVVSVMDKPGSIKLLRKFALLIIGISSAIYLVITSSNLLDLWFLKVAALAPPLAYLARTSFWFGILLPGVSVVQSYFQGMIVYGRKTRGVIEAVILYLITTFIVLGIGIILQNMQGLYYAVLAQSAAYVVQTFWLWYRSQPIYRMVSERDAKTDAAPAQLPLAP